MVLPRCLHLAAVLVILPATVQCWSSMMVLRPSRHSCSLHAGLLPSGHAAGTTCHHCMPLVHAAATCCCGKVTIILPVQGRALSASTCSSCCSVCLPTAPGCFLHAAFRYLHAQTLPRAAEGARPRTLPERKPSSVAGGAGPLVCCPALLLQVRIAVPLNHKSKTFCTYTHVTLTTDLQ
jgi:hypothetical protein